VRGHKGLLLLTQRWVKGRAAWSIKQSAAAQYSSLYKLTGLGIISIIIVLCNSFRPNVLAVEISCGEMVKPSTAQAEE